jgi:hypothetical protein
MPRAESSFDDYFKARGTARRLILAAGHTPHFNIKTSGPKRLSRAKFDYLQMSSLFAFT